MTVLIPAQRPAPATETIPDAATQAGAWLTEGNAVDSQRAFGTWRHYPIAPAEQTPAASFDPPGYPAI